MKKRVRSTKSNLKVYNYYGSAKKPRVNTSRSSSTARRRLFAYVRSIGIARLAVVLAVVGIIGFLLSVNTDPIIRFNDGALALRDSETYRQKSVAVLKSSIFNRNKLTFDYAGAESKLKAELPEITDVSISFDLIGRRPVFKINLRPPTFRVKSDAKVWVVDNRGIIIGEATDSGNDISKLPLITDEIGLADGGEKLGHTLMSPGEVSFLLEFISTLKTASLTPVNIYIPATLRELDIQLAGEAFRYKLSTDEQGREQAGTLIAARQELLSRGLTPKEYIDLRAGEKVYWR